MIQYHKTKFLLSAILLFFFFGCSSQRSTSQTTKPDVTNQAKATVESPLSLRDIQQSNKYNAQQVWGINNMKNGQSFSSLNYSGQFPKIDIYDFETGNKLKTIFDGSTAQVGFGEYEFSDDEKKILLATNTESIYRHSSKSDYLIYDTESNKLTPLSSDGKQSYPSFSPDGTKVAYIRDNNLYYLDLNTNQTVAVTTTGEWNKFIHGMSDWVYEEEFVLTKAYEWSNDSQQIAYFTFDEREVPFFTMQYFGDLYPENYTFKYPKAGEKNSIVSASVFTLTNRQSQVINTGDSKDVYLPRMYWTPQDELVIFKMNRHQNNIQLLKANGTSGQTTMVFEESNPYYISEGVLDEVQFLDNGDFLWTSERDGFYHVYLYGANGQLKNQITSGKWDVTQLYGYDTQSKKVYFQAAKESPLEREIYSINLDGSQLSKLSNLKGFNKAKFTDSFDYFINVASNTETPTITSVVSNTGETVRVLQDNADLKARVSSMKLPKEEFFTFNTVDGTSLNGWVMKPVNFDPKKKYPVLMFVYGGPGSQTVENNWATDNYWWHAYMTQQGYIIASVDNRGTGARGQEFEKSIYKDMGKLEVQDQTAAAKYLGSLDYVDASRIGIWGWSYGGYMSSNCLFQSNDVFKAAISVAPVTNWRYYDTIYTERYMRTPQENPSGYDNNSPINHVDGLQGKFLLVHGMGDDNVHFQNTVDLITALNTAGKQYDLAIYPNKNHGIYGGNTRYQLFEKMTNFIIENL